MGTVPRRWLRPWLPAALLLAVLGCGYSTGSLMPNGVERICVEMARNDTFYREDEFLLTRYVTQELIRRTHVQVRKRADAEAVLVMKITSLDRVPLVEVNRDVVSEEGLIGNVEVELYERSTGKTITKFNLKRRSEGKAPRGEDLTFERDALMRELAEDAVVELQHQSFLVERGYTSP